MSEVKGRDIMAVFHFYNGDVIEQKYEGCVAEIHERNVLTMYAAPPNLEAIFFSFDNGVIRQTKDIEKIIWSYC